MCTVKKSRLLFIFLFLIQFTGCLYEVKNSSFSSQEKFYEKVNELCSNEEVTIFTTAGDKFSGTEFHITGDTSSFYETAIFEQKEILTRDISYLSFHSSSKGLLRAATFGSIGGVGLGLFLGSIANKFFDWRAEIPGLIYVPVSAVLGVLIGISIIKIYGYEIKITFNQHS